MTIVDEPTTLEDISIESFFEDSVPCDSENCQSHHNEPATWMITHEGGQPRCTRLNCEPCKNHLIGFLKKYERLSVSSFKCTICGADQLSSKQIIVRKL